MSSISGVSGNSQWLSPSQLFAKMDADQSGSVSKEEFVAARPSAVSETKAGSLFDKLDASGSGSLSQSDIEGMEKHKKGHGKGQGTGQIGSLDESTLQALLQSLSQAGTSGTSSATSGQDQNLDDMITSMDTDGDGTITQSEFLAARPEGVSEDMATNLWSTFDTESTGSLSTSDLKTAMAENGPPPPPPGGMGGPGKMASSDEDETDPLQELIDQLEESLTSTASSTGTSSSSNSVLLAFLDAIKSYDASAGYDSTRAVMSSLLATA